MAIKKDSSKIDCNRILSVLPVGMLLSDANGVNVEVNDEAVRMTGYSREELLAGVWMIDPEDTVAWRLWQESLKGDTGTNYESRLIRKDGTASWVSISWRPMYDDDGVFAGVCTTMLDISEKKNTEERLSLAGRRLEELSDRTADLFWEMTADGRFTYVSNAVRSLGFEPADWVEHSIIEFLPEAEQIELSRLLADESRESGPRHYEMPLIKKDGTTVWLEILSDAIKLDGRVVGYRGVSRDITPRKQAEHALRESEERYKSIVENSRDMILLTTPTGEISYISPACYVLTGYTAQEILDDQLWLIHPDDTDRMRKEFQRARNGEIETGIEYRHITKQGETRWISQSWSPIMDDDKVRLIVSIIRDITDQKQAEQALQNAHKELKRAYKLQQEFINNVTHEVRTPLTAVKGYAEMLLEGLAGPVSEEQSSMLNKVLTSSDHLLQIVNGVLEVARLRSGKTAVNQRISNPRKAVDRAISAVLPQAAKKNLNIAVLPYSTGCPAMYDADKVQMIVTNLLTNAVKFTEKGTISVQVECTQDGAEIVVADTGIGIATRDLIRIFDEFSQLDFPGKHKPSGFGIGLALVATMVDMMGASLTVSSAKGVGTAFLLKLPAMETGS